MTKWDRFTNLMGQIMLASFYVIWLSVMAALVIVIVDSVKNGSHNLPACSVGSND